MRTILEELVKKFDVEKNELLYTTLGRILIDDVLLALKAKLLEGAPGDKELLIRPGKPKNSRYNKMVLGHNAACQKWRDHIEKVCK